MKPKDSNQLCLECGLCCNGAIFANGQLQPEDDVVLLKKLGLKLSARQKFKQPCAGFGGCRCNIYADRPKFCREFECSLLQKVKAGQTKLETAWRIIRTARRRAQRVARLLGELGDDDHATALGARFRRLQRRLESGETNVERARVFGELTVAMLQLNMILSGEFYPGSD